jgi:hypothetical protein
VKSIAPTVIANAATTTFRAIAMPKPRPTVGQVTSSVRRWRVELIC